LPLLCWRHGWFGGHASGQKIIVSLALIGVLATQRGWASETID